MATISAGLRRTIIVVVALNLGYFFVEFGVALRIGSVSLLADSADFLEDTGINVLILLALGWSARARARMGMGLAALLLMPALAFLWTLWAKFASPVPPEPVALSLTGLGAFAVNMACALLLMRHRSAQGSLTRAAFLSARNDAAANILIIAAGLLTLLWPVIWPDVVAGLVIAMMNLDAAHEVWEAARDEAKTPEA